MEEQNVKLTKLANCAGCGAKVGAGVLAQLLENGQITLTGTGSELSDHVFVCITENINILSLA